MSIAKEHRAIAADRVVELAVALGRGDLSREKAIEGFVSLVLEARITFVPPAAGAHLASAIAADALLSARFDALFARLRGSMPRRPQPN